MPQGVEKYVCAREELWAAGCGKTWPERLEFTVMPSLKPALWFTFQLCRGGTRPCWQSFITTKHFIVEPDLEYRIIINLSCLITHWICYRYRWNSRIYDLPKMFSSINQYWMAQRSNLTCFLDHIGLVCIMLGPGDFLPLFIIHVFISWVVPLWHLRNFPK